MVETSKAIRGPLVATVTAEGKSRVRDLYVVTAPVVGDLQRITIEAGDSVARGDVVARLEPPASRPLDARSRAEALAALSAASAAAAASDAAAREAGAALTHAESLLATARALRNIEARKALEHATHEAEIRREALAVARAAARQARAELARAEATAGRGDAVSAGPVTVVRSPIGGRVLRVIREDAGPVAAGTALLEIGNIGTLEFVSDFLTADAMSVTTGAMASIRDWGPGPPIPARVRLVEPGGFTKVSPLGLEEQRVRVVLDPVESPPAGLGNDFYVTVSIVVWRGENVIMIPSTALFRSGDRWAIYSVGEGRARLTPVMPGRSDGIRTLVESGIPEGQLVVTQPSDLIRNGTRVVTRRAQE